jgi:hypothetical protein
MGVNHILGWYYGKLSWNRMWCHSLSLVTRFGAGARKGTLLTSTKTSFKIREFKNGKEVSRVQVDGISQALPTVELDKDLSM